MIRADALTLARQIRAGKSRPVAVVDAVLARCADRFRSASSTIRIPSSSGSIRVFLAPSWWCATRRDPG